MASPVIGPDDPRAADVRALLERHLAYARAHTPPEDVHAMGVEDLLDPSVSFFSLRVDGRVLGVGALRRLDESHGEIKSMHTAEAARGRGLGRKMLEHLLAVAAERNWDRVSLETGTMEAFAPARALYARAGFVPCAPFVAHRSSPNSVCMTLVLPPGRREEP